MLHTTSGRILLSFLSNGTTKPLFNNRYTSASLQAVIHKISELFEQLLGGRVLGVNQDML